MLSPIKVVSRAPHSLLVCKDCLRTCASWFWKHPSLRPLPDGFLKSHHPYLQITASVSVRASYTHRSFSSSSVVTIIVRLRIRVAVASLMVQPMCTWNRRSR